MAAEDSHDDTAPCVGGRSPGPSPLELHERLAEEVSRAERQGTALSCLLVCLQDPEGLAREHGAHLPEQALAYMCGALSRQLRRFDRVGELARGELLVVLPGADQRRGEVVARRALGRLRAVKLELSGRRQPIGVCVGLAAWRDGLNAEQLLEQTRVAARCTPTPPPGRS